MKSVLLVITLALCSFESLAQYTQIPDPGFEQWLIDNGGDSEGLLDGQTLTADITDITEIEILDASSIADFTGLEDFSSLEMFECGLSNCTTIDFTGNPLLTSITVAANDLLTYIDLSNCPLLDSLFVDQNYLQTLDVSNCPLLTSLSCSDNEIDNIDLSNNTLLSSAIFTTNKLNSILIGQNSELVLLGCSFNELLSLDASGAPNLVQFAAIGNNLKSVDIRNGNNTNITNFALNDNPNLQCVYVDDVDYSIANWADGVDDTSVFALDESECALGLQNIKDFTFTIYPNPVIEYFSIEGTATIDQLVLFSLKGERVLEYSNYLQNQTVDITHLPKGIYILQLETPFGVVSEKVIKR